MATLVMTGGTSGFGMHTVQRWRQRGGRVLLGTRNPGAGGGELPLDLTSLEAVRAVLLTTSGTHDPAMKAGLALPRHANVRWLADPDQDPGAEPATARGGQEAYTASKLCTILTVRSLTAQQLVRERGLTVLAFCPGQVFGTGLAAGLSLPRRLAWRAMGTPLSAPLRRIVPTLNTREAAGKALAGLAAGEVPVPAGRSYVALRRGELTWPEVADLARDARAAQAAWADSADLVGLPA